jgi:hypothetical protein
MFLILFFPFKYEHRLNGISLSILKARVERQSDRKTERQRDKKTAGQKTNRETKRQRYRVTERQPDRKQTER